MEEALFLTKFASAVHVIHRRDRLRASQIMQRRALENGKINFVWNSVVEDVLSEDGNAVEGVALRNVNTSEMSDLELGGLFIAIGHTPNTGVFRGKIDMNKDGYIDTVPPGTHTSVEGIFACGDAADSIYRQAVTAAGTGCMAAIDAERWLAGNE